MLLSLVWPRDRAGAQFSPESPSLPPSGSKPRLMIKWRGRTRPRPGTRKEIKTPVRTGERSATTTVTGKARAGRPPRAELVSAGEAASAIAAGNAGIAATIGARTTGTSAIVARKTVSLALEMVSVAATIATISPAPVLAVPIRNPLVMKQRRERNQSFPLNGNGHGRLSRREEAIDLRHSAASPTSLDAAGIRHGSLLSSLGRGCLNEWQAWVEPLRQAEFDLLDIGSADGASLRLWREWFPTARLVGIDARRAHLALNIHDCRVVQGDQVEFATYRALLQEYRFRLVIADGSLHGRDQWQTFRLLLPWLEPGAVYACAGFDPTEIEAEREAVAHFADLGRAAMSPWFHQGVLLQNADIEPLLRRVASVTLGRRSVVVTTMAAQA